MCHISRRWWCELLSALLIAASCGAPASATDNVGAGVNTVWSAPVATSAGELKIVPIDENPMTARYQVVLNAKVILQTDTSDDASKFTDFPIPKVKRVFASGVPPFEQVVLFQQWALGNACNGGPLWFLGVRKDGSYQISDEIPFCGGRAPVIKQDVKKIVVVIPSGRPNRGSGHTPTKTWHYTAGKVVEVR